MQLDFCHFYKVSNKHHNIISWN